MSHVMNPLNTEGPFVLRFPKPSGGPAAQGAPDMRPTNRGSLITIAVLLATILTCGAFAQDRVKIKDGMIEGTTDKSSGIRTFKGIPFAEPPVGDLRWKPPQPVKKWASVRKTDQFGPRCMQRAVFGDMVFRS